MPKIEAGTVELFNTHKNCQSLFVTTDNQVFFRSPDAGAHAATLKVKTVKRVYRPEITEAQIKDIEATEAREMAEHIERTYRASFPEIAREIDLRRTRQP